MSITFKSTMPSDAELATMFGTVGTFDKYKVGDKVVTAGSTPILKRAKELAPRDTSGNGDKRSKNQKAKANWNIPLWKTVKRVIRKRESGALGIIGPEWPTGNKAYFNTSPNGRRVFYWGKDAGKTKVAIRNWIVQAADETRGQQLDAMKSKLQEVMGDVIRG
jgi:hypothetical protein